ncbi:MAG: DPP IV N-terminal domain-containing protein [Anaerolineales bacterium]
MKPNTRIAFIIILIGLIGLACSLTGADNNAAETSSPDALPLQETQSPLPGSDVLPFSLHFLSNMGDWETYQVWRLEKDAATQTQVTAEAVSITDFDVSPMDGRVAFIIDNQIFIVNPDGTGRALLVDGGQVDEEDSDYHFTRRISAVRWSPDGARIAFGRNGINYLDPATGEVTLILPNDLEPREGVYPYPQALYAPHTWSPDGSRLLVEIGFYEGSTLGVMDAASGAVAKLEGHIACCYPYWASDNRSVLVGSHWTGVTPAGLWRYNAFTGEKLELIPNLSSDGTLNFVGWPMERSDGVLQYFFTNTAAPPPGTPPLTLVQSANDGVTDRVQIRQENWDPHEALWAPDGSLVVLVEPYVQQAQSPQDGTIILIDALTDEPVRPLVVNGYRLRWGP